MEMTQGQAERLFDAINEFMIDEYEGADEAEIREAISQGGLLNIAETDISDDETGIEFVVKAILNISARRITQYAVAADYDFKHEELYGQYSSIEELIREFQMISFDGLVELDDTIEELAEVIVSRDPDLLTPNMKDALADRLTQAMMDEYGSAGDVRADIEAGVVGLAHTTYYDDTLDMETFDIQVDLNVNTRTVTRYIKAGEEIIAREHIVTYSSVQQMIADSDNIGFDELILVDTDETLLTREAVARGYDEEE